MTPLKIKDSTHNLGAPMNWDAEKNGPCHDLHVMVEARADGHAFHSESAWSPSAEELDALTHGGGVIIPRVAGWQVPVALYVDSPDRAVPENNDEPKS